MNPGFVFISYGKMTDTEAIAFTRRVFYTILEDKTHGLPWDHLQGEAGRVRMSEKRTDAKPLLL